MIAYENLKHITPDMVVLESIGTTISPMTGLSYAVMQDGKHYDPDTETYIGEIDVDEYMGTISNDDEITFMAIQDQELNDYERYYKFAKGGSIQTRAKKLAKKDGKDLDKVSDKEYMKYRMMAQEQIKERGGNLDDYDLSTYGGSKGYINHSIKQNEKIIKKMDNYLNSPMENSEEEYRSREMVRMDKAKLEAEILRLKDELKEYAKGGNIEDYPTEEDNFVIIQNVKKEQGESDFYYELYDKLVAYGERPKIAFAEMKKVFDNYEENMSDYDNLPFAKGGEVITDSFGDKYELREDEEININDYVYFGDTGDISVVEDEEDLEFARAGKTKAVPFAKGGKLTKNTKSKIRHAVDDILDDDITNLDLGARGLSEKLVEKGVIDKSEIGRTTYFIQKEMVSLGYYEEDEYAKRGQYSISGTQMMTERQGDKRKLYGNYEINGKRFLPSIFVYSKDDLDNQTSYMNKGDFFVHKIEYLDKGSMGGMKKLPKYVIYQKDESQELPFAKGGKTDWVQSVVDSPNFRKGAFTKKAKARGMTPTEFMKKVLANPSNYNMRTRRQAQFMKNI